jgi:DNA mismatch endonuclease (patch repair protein)
MSANRAKNSKPELCLRKALWQAGHRGYRLHHKIRLPKNSPPYEGGVAAAAADGVVLSSRTTQPKRSQIVRPDIAFVSKKLAIFVHGCYWHHCPKCAFPIPKNNAAFWQAKFDRNTARDKQKRADLKKLGWQVISVWECDLKNRFAHVLRKISKACQNRER